MPTAPPRAPASRKGTCRAIFAVTGVVDEVSDLILPGAFAHTLATRPVKSVWHHEWKDPVGVVLEISEWQPGDPRFADIPGWPAEAGALVATIQFNLRTQRGRDVYEQVRQWHEHGEAQFSIGYRVPPGCATKRSDGVRVIHKLDLYEVSPVLHGAHPMTRSLEVKSDGVELEHKTTTSSGHLDIKAAEPQVGQGAMVALYLPAGAAGKVAHPDGTAARDLHVTLAYLGNADRLPGHPDDLADVVRGALDGAEPVEGRIGGIGRFPDRGDGEPVFIPVDVPGLSELRQRVVDAIARSPLAPSLDTAHGFTPHVTLGYGLPLDTPAVPPLPVTFDAVHVVRGHDSTPIRLRGRLVVTDTDSTATGLPNGPRVPIEEKSAHAAVRRAQAAASSQPRVSARSVVLEAKSRIPMGASVSPIQPLPASFEEIRERVSTALHGLLGSEDGTWCCVEATYPGRAIVSVHQADTVTRTYAVPYSCDGPDVSLGTPEAVELTTVVIPEQGPVRSADDAEAVDSRLVQPTLSALAEATARVQAADTSDQMEPVRASVRELLDALSAKGLDVAPSSDNDEEEPEAAAPVMAGNGIDLWDDPYDEPHETAEDRDDEPDPPDDDANRDTDLDEEASIRLTADEVKSQLAAIQL
ncbi:2'-5' RNA ligase family protein [Streptomyces sp. bgisy060]|uniref:2'-5' RNA ligase family protein n=1 Tax=Streptomyces sp. bgisy060 TaxID=3413775 RepID=UPI003EBA4CE7